MNNTPYEPPTDDEEEIIYTVDEEVTFSGEIVSIHGNKITLDDGTMVNITENTILSGNYLTFTVTAGPTDHEFYITEVTSQSSLLINPGSNVLDVNLIDGEGEVYGNITIIGCNIIQVLDKRFILNNDTVFSAHISDGDPLFDDMISVFEVGDLISGYGVANENNEVSSGTIMTIMVS
ncbi:hypothetical protein HF295_00495 [Hujiaoplasma nucleasis]|uniref:Uncharacterized protein n=1 Tax=Hujiaoplasma nucleasis TaxID=2725268 RepID=A0A7L6MZJ8_9MOLU|nr:hypothetical protein [Hujiaoplasma nucleasis]QLY39416.1 hypothetical protein HF295_00495 [Hujiaoplasma nucleasis]